MHRITPKSTRNRIIDYNIQLFGLKEKCSMIPGALVALDNGGKD
jgi:hypothetical protein